MSNKKIVSLDFALSEMEKNYWTTETSGLKKTEERRAAWRPAILRGLQEAFLQASHASTHARSPIEELFIAALWENPHQPNKHIESDNGVAAWTSDPSEPNRLNIVAQAPVGPYFVDFLLTLHSHGYGSSRVAVECDGHDFHEKTKAQAAHDKKRDRFFAAQDLPVLRFTGSEIFRNAEHCAHEAIVLLAKRLK